MARRIRLAGEFRCVPWAEAISLHGAAVRDEIVWGDNLTLRPVSTRGRVKRISPQAIGQFTVVAQDSRIAKTSGDYSKRNRVTDFPLCSIF
jgi:hypothetical protein